MIAYRMRVASIRFSYPPDGAEHRCLPFVPATGVEPREAAHRQQVDVGLKHDSWPPPLSVCGSEFGVALRWGGMNCKRVSFPTSRPGSGFSATQCTVDAGLRA